jgi:hypothetical protein
MGTESGIWNRVAKEFFASPSMSQPARQLLDYYDKKQSEDFTKQDHWLKQLSERDNKGGRSPLGDETLLLPDRVFGFVLRTRTWSMGLDVFCYPVVMKLILRSLLFHRTSLGNRR